MVSNVAEDQFTLTLEAIWLDGATVNQVRGFATNRATKLTAEVQLTLDQTHEILEYVYGGELSIVKQHFEDVKAGHALELMAASKDPLVFFPPDLLRFGFNAHYLEETLRTPGSAGE